MFIKCFPSHRTVWQWIVVLSLALPVLAADISPEMLVAAKDGNVEAVKALLWKGQDVNATSSDGVTALMIAASENKVSVVKLLLTSGANPRLKTKTGKTASYFAEARGYREVLGLLQQSGTSDSAGPSDVATLLVRVDADSVLTVDGTVVSKMKAGQAKQVKVSKGDHLVEAVVADGTARWEKTINIKEPGQVFVDAQLAPVVEAARRKALEQEEAERTLKAAQEKRAQEEREVLAGLKVNEKDRQIYVWIPPGTFQMGCSVGDAACENSDDPYRGKEAETPTHEVTITKGFWLGQTPVTQEAYQLVVGNNPSHFKGDKFPVEQVNWNEAQGYCQAAGMRLPTEAEWEYAARGGSTGIGYGDLDQFGYKNSEYTTHAVGQKQANAFGLYDMLGNVSQWVADWYAKYPAGTQRDPAGPTSGQYRVLRGGSTARASRRNSEYPDNHWDWMGLRCAGDLMKATKAKKSTKMATKK